MQISSASAYGPTGSPLASNSGQAGSTGATASSGASASQDNSVVQDFLSYAKMSPMERLRASILKTMGLTQQQLDKMPPAERQAVEQKIEEMIKQQLQQNAGKTGQLVSVSA